MGLVVGDTEKGLKLALSDPLYSLIDLRGGGHHLIYVRESRPLLCAVPWLADARLEGVPVIDERMRITGMITHDEMLHVMKTGEDEVKRFFLRIRVEEAARHPLVFSLHDELKRVIAEFIEEKQTVGVVVNSAGFPITIVNLCDMIKSLLNHEQLRSLLSKTNALNASARVKKTPAESTVMDVMTSLTSNGTSATELDDTHYYVSRASLVNGLLSSSRLLDFIESPHKFLRSFALDDRFILLRAHHVSQDASVLEVAAHLMRTGEDQIVELNDEYYMSKRTLCYTVASILLEFGE